MSAQVVGQDGAVPRRDDEGRLSLGILGPDDLVRGAEARAPGVRRRRRIAAVDLVIDRHVDEGRDDGLAEGIAREGDLPGELVREIEAFRCHEGAGRVVDDLEDALDETPAEGRPELTARQHLDRRELAENFLLAEGGAVLIDREYLEIDRRQGCRAHEDEPLRRGATARAIDAGRIVRGAGTVSERRPVEGFELEAEMIRGNLDGVGHLETDEGLAGYVRGRRRRQDRGIGEECPGAEGKAKQNWEKVGN